MKRLCVLLFLSIFFCSFSSAVVNEYNYFKLGEINSAGDLVKIGSPVSGVNIKGFVCSSGDCSGSLGDLWGGAFYVDGSGINLVYPTSQSSYGYGFWVYKNGYVPYWVKGVNWYGSGIAPNIDRYLSKIRNCVSDVSIKNFINDNGKVSFSVLVNSPKDAKYGSIYVPSEIAPYLRNLISVNVEVRDSNGVRVWGDDESVYVDYSGNKLVSFSTSAFGPGNYNLIVSSSLGDDVQCLDYSSDVENFEFEVIDSKNVPSVFASAYPSSGYAPLGVHFSCQGSGGDGTLTYLWDFGDGFSSSSQNPYHVYSSVGNFDASCRVRDSDGDEVFGHVNVNAVKRQPEIIIKDIVCFDEVIKGHNQSCSVYLEDSVGGADVDIFYSDGSLFGSCVSDGINGSCVVKDLQNIVGNFEVYAIASKLGYVSDNNKNPNFVYKVVEEKYNIVGLSVYNDSSYSNEDYDFFRGENLFVKFEVENLSGAPAISDLISNVSLVSSVAGGRVELERVMKVGNTYYYRLIPIPVSHDFIGDSNAFAFVFDGDFEEQEEVSLVIRNNLPIASFIGKKSVKDGKNFDLNLNSYESDIEDSGDDLRWEIVSFGDNVNVNLTGKVLNVEGDGDGVSVVVLRLFDLDGDFDEVRFDVEVSGDSGDSDHDSDCVADWECSAWGSCFDGFKSRVCFDKKNCRLPMNRPADVMRCDSMGALNLNNSEVISLGDSDKKNEFEFSIWWINWMLIFLILLVLIFLILILKK